jgi:Na+-translocating ferredoxin:NAD+ oxidoreductase RNF subunit RnfB
MFIQQLLASANILPNMVGALGALDLTSVGIATAVVGGTGLFIGLFLGVAAKKFEVEVDERETQVRALLPGANCGGCGYAGCDALAKAIAEGKVPANACPVAVQADYDKIAAVMGTTAAVEDDEVAFVKCAGTCDKTEISYEYHGVWDCKKASLAPGNAGKKCGYGCMGFGSCVKVCKFDAIHVVNGVAVVDSDKCTGCSSCIAECPNKLIELVPHKSNVKVGCSSRDKGKDVKAACSIGCIGCKLCVKACEFDAIHVEDNLAYIDYSKCTNCGKCAAVCPVKVIQVQQS